MNTKRKYKYFEDIDKKSSSIAVYLTILGIVITIISIILCVAKSKGIQFDLLLSFIGLFVGLICVFLPNTIGIYRIINKMQRQVDCAYGNGLLSDAISAALYASSKEDEEKKKFKHFLKEITQAERLNPLYISFDDTPYDDLYDMRGTLSITDAPIFAWKNPEYSWFLLNHYVASVLKQIGLYNNSIIKIENRNGEGFKEFILKEKKVLQTISEGTFDYNTFVRFYLITETEFMDNRAMFEQFVAGHELFGINLFLVNKDKVIKDEQLNAAFFGIKRVLKDSDSQNSVLDVMVYEKTNKEKGYKIGINGKLENESITPETEIACDRFIADLAKKIDNNNDLLFYPIIDDKRKSCSYGLNGPKCNKKRTFLHVINAK